MKIIIPTIILLLLMMTFASATVTITDFKFDKTNESSAKLSFQMKNTGSTVERGLVEMEFVKPGTTLSIISEQSTCENPFPYNVHRDYYLNPGETAYLTLTATGIPSGTFDVAFNHADQCCNLGSCSGKEPYGFRYKVTSVSFGDPYANKNDQCGNDFEAGQYLVSKGTLNCASPRCLDASTLQSVATCDAYGECNTGAVQTQECSDKKTFIQIRNCQNAKWVDTGSKCPSDPILPPPDNTKLPIFGILGGLVVGALAYAFTKNMMWAIVGGVLGAIVMLVVVGI